MNNLPVPDVHFTVPPAFSNAIGSAPHKTLVSLGTALGIACAIGSLGALIGHAAEAPVDPKTAGIALAEDLRNHRPTEGSTNAATLKLRDRSGRRSTIPVQIETSITPNGWKSRYTSASARGTGVVHALIVQEAGTAPRYELASTVGATPTSAGAGQADLALAGSDVWVSDLALEFLHWPEQKLLRDEPSGGRMCHVLESTNPGTNGYGRVLSWVDIKYSALLNAEAFDRSGKLVKRFSTGSFKKITRADGQEAWFLQDVKISDRRTDSVTELSFEIPDSAK
jgi:hypothetical protein